jgi:hypothetical protein
MTKLQQTTDCKDAGCVRLRQRLTDLTSGLRRIAIGVALASICLWSGSSVGQQVTADAVGRVSDITGAVVPKALVTITNLETHEIRKTTTSEEGDFAFNLLQIGSYTVKVEMQGFKTVEIPAFSLSVGERHRLDVQMQVGSESEQVVVTSEPPVLQTDQAGLGQTLEAQAVQDLPTQGRNAYSLVQLAPGANAGPANGVSSGNRPDDRRQASEVSANGQSDSRNNNLLDGMDNNTRNSNIIVVRPSIDAIQELSVLTNSYPAEVGNVSGAVVNMITKAGSNQFHGTAYEYIRNNIFDARNYFTRAPLAKPKYIQNQFGGSLGGPIRQNKTFFFVDAEDLRIVKGQTSTVTVPTLYEEQHPGDFSDNNDGPVIPTEYLDPAGLALFNLYPAPNAPGAPLANNYTGSPTGTAFAFTGDVRIDHHFGANDQMFGRFSYNKAAILTPGILPEVDGIQPGGNVFGFEGTANETAMNEMLDYTHIFTPTLILELKQAYTRFINDYSTLNGGKNVSQQLGIPNINVNANSTGLTGIYPVGYASLGESTFEPNVLTFNTFQEAGIVSYVRGTHSLKAGASLIRRQSDANAAGAYPVGIFFFVYVPGLPYITPNPMANVLLGLSTVAERQNNLVENRLRSWEPSGFIQDDWRVTPKITLNLGVRYDVFTAQTDAKNNLANLDLATSQMIVASSANPTAGVTTDYTDVAPRVGFSASLTKNTVLHGAFALSFFPANTQNTFFITNPPFLSSFGPNYLVPLSGMSAPAPIAINNLSGTVYATPKNFPSSYAEEFNISVQQQVGQNNVITVAYVGELGRKISLAGGFNIDLPAPSPLPNPLSRAPFVSTLPNLSALDYLSPTGTSSYNGLQASFNRRFSQGFSMNANYTWSHSLDDIAGSSYSPEPYGLLPTKVSTYDYGDSDLDLRNRFAISASYTFPFLNSLTGVKGKLLKGWQMNGIAFWQSGAPFTITNSVPQINLGPAVTADRPDRIASGHIPNQSINEWFDTTAFVPQAFGTAGDSMKNILRGPHQRRVDLSIFRDFPLFDRVNLQFRAESYDISNTPAFDQPNSGLNTGGYGTISDTLPGSDPRVYQFALKVIF